MPQKGFNFWPQPPSCCLDIYSTLYFFLYLCDQQLAITPTDKNSFNNKNKIMWHVYVIQCCQFFFEYLCFCFDKRTRFCFWIMLYFYRNSGSQTSEYDVICEVRLPNPTNAFKREEGKGFLTIPFFQRKCFFLTMQSNKKKEIRYFFTKDHNVFRKILKMSFNFLPSNFFKKIT